MNFFIAPSKIEKEKIFPLLVEARDVKLKSLTSREEVSEMMEEMEKRKKLGSLT